MEPPLAPLAAILDLNTDLLLNTLHGLGDEDVRARPAGGGNSLVFLAAHLTDTRHFLAERVGHPLANPVASSLADARTIDDIAAWPPLADGTRLGMIAFLVQHDSYHVGQMAFLRRQLGKTAMSYRRGAGASR